MKNSGDVFQLSQGRSPAGFHRPCDCFHLQVPRRLFFVAGGGRRGGPSRLQILYSEV